MSRILFLLLFFTASGVCLLHRNEAYAPVGFAVLMQYAVTYGVSSLLFSISATSELFRKLIVAVLSLAAFAEAVIAILQLTGTIFPANSYFLCTGTFSNPGPLGGFLAVSAIVTAGYTVRVRNGRLSAYLPTAAAVMLLPATMSRAAVLALFSGTALYLSYCKRLILFLKRVYARHKNHVTVAAAVLAFAFIASAVFMYNLKKESAYGRIFMSGITLKAINEAPLAGHGPGKAVAAYGNAQFRFFTGNATENRYKLCADCPEYVFNTFLSTGVEYGVPAMLLLIAAIAYSIAGAMRIRPELGAGLMALSVFAVFSYPHELPVFRILMSVLAAGDTAVCHCSKLLLRRYIAIPAVLVTGLLVFLFITVPVHRAEREWKKAEVYYQQERYATAITEYEPLFSRMRHNYRYLFQYGHALLKTGDYARADSILRMGADYSCDPMFWNLIGQTEQTAGNYAEAEKCYLRAFYSVPNRIYPLYLLARLYQAAGDTANLAELRRRIRYFKPKIESETTESFRREIDSLEIVAY